MYRFLLYSPSLFYWFAYSYDCYKDSDLFMYENNRRKVMFHGIYGYLDLDFNLRSYTVYHNRDKYEDMIY